MRIKKTMFFTYVSIAVIPIIVITIIFSNILLSLVKKDNEKYTNNLSENVLNSIDNVIDDVDRIMLMTYNLPSFQDHLIKSAEISKDDYDWAYQIMNIDDMLKNDLLYIFYQSSVIENVIIIDKSMNAYYIGNGVFNSNIDFKNQYYYKEIIRQKGKKYIFKKGSELFLKNKEEDYFAIGRVVKSKENMEIIGTMIVTINTKMLRNTCANLIEDDNQRFIIETNSNEILLDSQSDMNEIPNNLIAGTHRINYNGLDYLLTVNKSKLNGFQFLWFIPYNNLTKKTSWVINIGITIAIIFIIIAVITSMVISHNISRPIITLKKLTQKVSKGNFDVVSKIKCKNEIGELSNSFNIMTRKINNLLINEKKNRNEFLASQINPHFVYNSLDSIYMSAIYNDDMDTAEIIGNLNQLLKMVVREKCIITLRRELEIVDSYIRIQKMRYEGKFDIRIDVPDNLLDTQVPKMILQPIVENAIIHGVLEYHRKGKIVLSAFKKGNKIILSVKNTGYPINNDKLTTLNNSFKKMVSDPSVNIGLKNIYERLKLEYKEDADINIIDCHEFEGVNVIIEIKISDNN